MSIEQVQAFCDHLQTIFGLGSAYGVEEPHKGSYVGTWIGESCQPRETDFRTMQAFKLRNGPTRKTDTPYTDITMRLHASQNTAESLLLKYLQIRKGSARLDYNFFPNSFDMVSVVPDASGLERYARFSCDKYGRKTLQLSLYQGGGTVPLHDLSIIAHKTGLETATFTSHAEMFLSGSKVTANETRIFKTALDNIPTAAHALLFGGLEVIPERHQPLPVSIRHPALPASVDLVHGLEELKTFFTAFAEETDTAVGALHLQIGDQTLTAAQFNPFAFMEGNFMSEFARAVKAVATR